MSDAPPFLRWLTSQGAARDLVAWIESSGLDWPEVYDACPRADYLLAIAVRAGAPSAIVTEVAAALASHAVHDVLDHGVASAVSELSTRIREDTDAELIAFAERSQTAADAAHDFVISHAYRAIALAAESRSNPEAAAMLPSVAVEIALASVMDCAMTSVLGSTHHDLVNLVRAHLPVSRIPLRW